MVAILDHHFVSANVDRPPPPPQPLERPGVARRHDGMRIGNTEQLDLDEVRAYLDRFKPPEE